jgi:glycosyltransferase involved in cell wall biosynthesis
MARSRADVWHATYVPPTIRTRDYVYTLVCSSMIERPELYPPAVRVRLVALTRLAIRQARTIICISEHIRQVVQERFRVPDDRLAVTYLGVSDDFQPLDPEASRAFVRERYGVDRPYFLFSGRWEPRKNIMRIIEAFHRFKRETGSPAQLVFTGERTWAADEADRLIAGYGLSDDVVILGKSPVEELPQLYSGAEALVYPSLWEGFGLPIVEGMAAGLPVITSNNSSMAEVGGDAVELVDPLRVEDIAEAMAAIAGDPAHRETLRERGLARARIFDWRRTAEQTLAVYREQGRA